MQGIPKDASPSSSKRSAAAKRVLNPCLSSKLTQTSPQLSLNYFTRDAIPFELHCANVVVRGVADVIKETELSELFRNKNMKCQQLSLGRFLAFCTSGSAFEWLLFPFSCLYAGYQRYHTLSTCGGLMLKAQAPVLVDGTFPAENVKALQVLSRWLANIHRTCVSCFDH